MGTINFMNQNLWPIFLLHKIGGSNVSKVSADTFATNLMDTIKNCGVAVGAIIIAWATIKMIIALADENVAERSRASLLLGVGIFFVSISTIVTELFGAKGVIGPATDSNTVAAAVITILGKMMSYAGAIMGVYGVFSFIMSIAHEDAGQKAKASTSILVAVGLLSAQKLCSQISAKIGAGDTTGTNYITPIITFIGAVATYAGGGLAAIGIFQFIMAIRDEDTKGRNEAIKLLMIAIALVSFPRILKMMGLI